MRNYSYIAEYKAEVSKYQTKDGINAIGFFLFYCVMLFALGVTRRLGWDTFITGTVFLIVVIAAIVALVLIKKEGLSSIGFRRKNLWPALRLGLLFGFIPVLIGGGLIPGLIIYNWEFQAFSAIVISTLITFFNAAHEDMIFVGYIQTRLYGLIKRDYMAILAGACLFSLMHIMPQLGQHGLEAFNFGNLIWLLVLIPMHVFMNALFRRYYSIYPVMILHTLNNGAANMWVSTDSFWLGRGNLIVVGVYVLVFGIWILYLRRKESESSKVEGGSKE